MPILHILILSYGNEISNDYHLSDPIVDNCKLLYQLQKIITQKEKRSRLKAGMATWVVGMAN